MLAVALVIAQLVLGLTVSVITSIDGDNAKTAVIILGAVNSAVGGIAALMQYRGQPARSSRYFQTLMEVQSDVNQELGHFRGDRDYTGDKMITVANLVKRFQAARREAFANDPLVYDRM